MPCPIYPCYNNARTPAQPSHSESVSYTRVGYVHVPDSLPMSHIPSESEPYQETPTTISGLSYHVPGLF